MFYLEMFSVKKKKVLLSTLLSNYGFYNSVFQSPECFQCLHIHVKI